MARGRNIGFLLAVVAVLAVVPVAYWFFFREPPPPPLPPPVAPKVEAPKAPVVPTDVALAGLTGTVLVRHGANGPWTRATSGTFLGADDGIRTGRDGSVDLVAGNHLVHLVPGTDVQVKQLATDLSRFLLGTGMVTARARAGKGVQKGHERTLQVDVKGTDVAARAKKGTFTMTSNGRGLVKVASHDGRVHVAAQGKEVVLHGGQETLVRPGHAPGPPRPAATSLLLKVRWPEKRALNHREITIAGRTAAGAIVFVGGKPVRVDSRGNFRAHVRLREGRNHVSVEARDVAGNKHAAKSPKILVDTHGAKAKFNTKGLWGK